MAGTCRVGVSGWVYPPWRGVFYPKGLPHRAELSYLAARLSTIEINGTFYSLQLPTSYRKWYEQTPAGFVLSVKAPRFVTHMKKLRGVETALANFFASGLFALADKLGPILWQLPPGLPFDAGRIEAFLALLPRSTGEAAWLARRHDARLEGRALTVPATDRPLRHAMEVRHGSYLAPAFTELLTREHVAAVIADTGGKWPRFSRLTADFGYLRLHGDVELYTSGYTEEALRGWAGRIRAWTAQGHDVFVYFDNDVKVHAPSDAERLIELLA